MFQRTCTIVTATADTAVAASTVIPFGNFAGGQVFVPTGSSITALTWYGSHDGTTFLPIEDGAGNAVTSIFSSSAAAAKSCLIPAACFGCAFLKAVASGAAGTIYLSLKS